MRTTRRLGTAEDGVTLVELLVAMAIITTALFALMSGFVAAAASLQNQQAMTRATRVALDQNERLRLEAFESAALTPGTRTGTSTAPGGVVFSYSTTVSERDSRPAEDVAGDIVKDVSTTVSWTQRGKTRQVTQTTGVAADARTIGLGADYQQVIRSMSVAPDPSASVNYLGYTSSPIVVTIVMTGHAVSDVVTVTYQDDNGSNTRTATSTDARYWRLTLPAGSAGLKKALGQNQKFNMTFTATTTTGLTSSSTLAVWGPVTNPPTITAFSVDPNPISMFANGNNRFQNKTDVNFSCTVTGLSPTATDDNVKVRYIGETGATVEDALTRSTANATSTIWTKTFARSTTYFGTGANLPYTCVVTRGSDGGPASTLISVTVAK